MGTISTPVFYDDLTGAERRQLEDAAINALIAQAKSDLPAADVDVRYARPTLDLTMGGASSFASTWIFALTGAGTLDELINHPLTDEQNMAMLAFGDVGRVLRRFVVANATTTLADVELANFQVTENPLAFFRTIITYKKRETIIVQAEGNFDPAGPLGGADFMVPLVILIAEPSGLTVGTKGGVCPV